MMVMVIFKNLQSWPFHSCTHFVCGSSPEEVTNYVMQHALMYTPGHFLQCNSSLLSWQLMCYRIFQEVKVWLTRIGPPQNRVCTWDGELGEVSEVLRWKVQITYLNIRVFPSIDWDRLIAQRANWYSGILHNVAESTCSRVQYFEVSTKEFSHAGSLP